MTPERFWARVDQSGGAAACWPWLGNKLKEYGRVGFRCRNWAAHRLAWFFAFGAEPTGEVRHSCDNPPCCNPAHLADGTHAENMADMAVKGRAVAPWAGQKLSEATKSAMSAAKLGVKLSPAHVQTIRQAALKREVAKRNNSERA